MPNYLCPSGLKFLIQRNLEVKLLTYGQMQQQVWEESARRKKIQVPEKVEKLGNTDFFL